MVFIPTYRSLNSRRGFGLVEIVVGASIISLVMLSVSFFFQRTSVVSNTTSLAVQANYLLVSGVEVIQNLRGTTWNHYIASKPIASLGFGQKYYYGWNGGQWDFFTYYIPDGIFARTIIMQPVSRDVVTGEILPAWDSNAEYDPNTREVTVSVEWPVRGGASSTMSVTTYVTNIFKLP